MFILLLTEDDSALDVAQQITFRGLVAHKPIAYIKKDIILFLGLSITRWFEKRWFESNKYYMISFSGRLTKKIKKIEWRFCGKSNGYLVEILMPARKKPNLLKKGKGKQTKNPKNLWNILICATFMIVQFNSLNSQIHHRIAILLPYLNSFTGMSPHVVAAVENFTIKVTLTHREI